MTFRMFKSVAVPEPWAGITIEGPDMVVPNQALSLQEIIERFTRGEALPIEKEFNYHESDDDLEKIRHMDLVDREEYMSALERVKARYNAYEQKKAKEAAEKIEAETRAKIEAETRAKVAAEKSQQI